MLIVIAAEIAYLVTRVPRPQAKIEEAIGVRLDYKDAHPMTTWLLVFVCVWLVVTRWQDERRRG
jgi:hypothetical protein